MVLNQNEYNSCMNGFDQPNSAELMVKLADLPIMQEDKCFYDQFNGTQEVSNRSTNTSALNGTQEVSNRSTNTGALFIAADSESCISGQQWDSQNVSNEYYEMMSQRYMND